MTQKLGVAFANRFHLVANRYARVVNGAYNGDQEAAMRNSDATVAARVREWELAHGIEPRDWLEIGRAEGTLTRKSGELGESQRAEFGVRTGVRNPDQKQKSS